ncbi:hypothetical protein K2173_016324 [Erythroxylum novogranatense]|uniref:Uncharacterized protein n=1 Tax=Erythroxylum novogranatense TaxID=1862640 RepID=A0AAV8SGL8_9ROSI|nr:hypothetical protein K2173_016324 [Erythroxylum novogranatense]
MGLRSGRNMFSAAAMVFSNPVLGLGCVKYKMLWRPWFLCGTSSISAGTQNFLRWWSPFYDCFQFWGCGRYGKLAARIFLKAVALLGQRYLQESIFYYGILQGDGIGIDEAEQRSPDLAVAGVRFMSSWWKSVQPAAKDPILSVTEAFLANHSLNKVNVGVVSCNPNSFSLAVLFCGAV